jgi:hypothetical protein
MGGPVLRLVSVLVLTGALVVLGNIVGTAVGIGAFGIVVVAFVVGTVAGSVGVLKRL